MLELTTASDATQRRQPSVIARLARLLDEGRALSEHVDYLPTTTSRLAIGAAVSLIFDEIRAGRSARLDRLTPDLVFAVLMPFIGPEAAAEEMRARLK